jgi:hypothetical protein
MVYLVRKMRMTHELAAYSSNADIFWCVPTMQQSSG